MMLELFELSYPNLTYVLVGLFSLLIGSFVNVVIYRLPIMLKTEWSQQTPNLPLSLAFPRSFCPLCKSKLSAWQNVPLLSFIFLKGRCRHCKVSISKRYPLVETLSACLAILAFSKFNLTVTFFFSLLFIWISISLTFIDWETFLLPDSLTLGLLWVGLIANTNALFTPLNDAVLTAASTYLILRGLLSAYTYIKGKPGMGQGDFKLFAAQGAWFGSSKLPLILCFASTLGLIFGGLYLLCTKKSRDTPIPFGPFIVLAGLMVLFGVEKIFGLCIDNL